MSLVGARMASHQEATSPQNRAKALTVLMSLVGASMASHQEATSPQNRAKALTVLISLVGYMDPTKGPRLPPAVVTSWLWQG